MAIYHLILSAVLALSYLQSELHTKVPNLNSTEWVAYKQQYEKSYPSEEVDSLRKLIFFANKLKVEKFNQEHEDFKLGVNHLSDRTEEEINNLNGFRGDSAVMRNSVEDEQFLQSIFERDVEVPDELDWRKTPNRVSEVKDQGDCGSCCAFSAIGALEGQEIPIHKSKLDPLSVQNLVDCAERERKNNTNGCKGGLPKDAYDYVKRFGLETEQDYPYEGVFKDCRFKKSKSFLQDDGGVYLPSGDEEKLKEAVAKYGPISVGIQADIFFAWYDGGVFYDKECQSDLNKLNHGVLVVGYGHGNKTGKDYWLVKNSWGTDWGEAGYVRMIRNKDNNCGIATAPSIPNFEQGQINSALFHLDMKYLIKKE